MIFPATFFPFCQSGSGIISNAKGQGVDSRVRGDHGFRSPPLTCDDTDFQAVVEGLFSPPGSAHSKNNGENEVERAGKAETRYG